MFLMDRFFNGAFLTFGLEVIAFAERDQEDRLDPMIYIFPRMTKCTFHKFGTSGEVEKHDALCILPLNIVNEKIYIFLWFWLLLLGCLSTLVVAYRLGGYSRNLEIFFLIWFLYHFIILGGLGIMNGSNNGTFILLKGVTAKRIFWKFCFYNLTAQYSSNLQNSCVYPP